jgi:hypothetical protein
MKRRLCLSTLTLPWLLLISLLQAGTPQRANTLLSAAYTNLEPSNAPEPVLFDDFEDEYPAWAQYLPKDPKDGFFEHWNGVFRSQILGNNALLIAWPGWRPAGDFELEVDARFSSPDAGSVNGLGLAFGGVDDWRDFYALMLWQKREQHNWAAVRFVDGRATSLPNGGGGSAPDFVRPRLEWNHLMVRSIADRIYVYCNDHRLNDQPLDYGQPGSGPNHLVGLVVKSHEYSNGTIIFDNYRLTPLPKHTIAGYVRDESGRPLPGITLSAGAAGSVSTDIHGAYIFTGVLPGTYALVPERDAITFAPKSRTISVPPGTAGRDFVGNVLYDRYIYLPCLLKD